MPLLNLFHLLSPEEGTGALFGLRLAGLLAWCSCTQLL